MNDYERIQKVIEFISSKFKEQPNLDELANLVNLSPYHFHHLFRRWVGISPKRFLQYVTCDYAKKLLDESRDILAVSLESGLSGPSRLHDLFVNIEAVSPGEFKSKGKNIEIFYGVHDSPFGKCLLSITERGICGFSFHNNSESSKGIERLKQIWKNAKVKEAKHLTTSVFKNVFQTNKNNHKKSFNLFMKGTNFQIKVWEALINIPSGYLSSYSDIAKYIGEPKAARAVGKAVSQNPIAYLIPCHRVIRNMGNIGSYQWGVTRKKAIIGWEAARKNVN